MSERYKVALDSGGLYYWVMGPDPTCGDDDTQILARGCSWPNAQRIARALSLLDETERKEVGPTIEDIPDEIQWAIDALCEAAYQWNRSDTEPDSPQGKAERDAEKALKAAIIKWARPSQVRRQAEAPTNPEDDGA